MKRKPWRVPALTQRHPPGCPDPDWCAGNGRCDWDCTGYRSYDEDEGDARREGDIPDRIERLIDRYRDV